MSRFCIVLSASPLFVFFRRKVLRTKSMFLTLTSFSLSTCGSKINKDSILSRAGAERRLVSLDGADFRLAFWPVRIWENYEDGSSTERWLIGALVLKVGHRFVCQGFF